MLHSSASAFICPLFGVILVSEARRRSVCLGVTHLAAKAFLPVPLRRLLCCLAQWCPIAPGIRPQLHACIPGKLPPLEQSATLIWGRKTSHRPIP